MGTTTKISRNIVALGVVSFLTDTSTEMVFAILPFFMVQDLKIKMAAVGVIEGAAESAASFVKVVSGIASDKLGKRKGLTGLGYGLSTLVKPFFAVTNSALQVAAVRLLDRVGKGVRTSPRDALIADSSEDGVRGKAYGLHRTLDQLGAVVGPLLAFLLFPFILYRGVFMVSLIPGIASVGVLFFFVKEAAAKRHLSHEGFADRWNSFTREFKIYVAIATFFTLSNFSYAFFLLRAGELGLSPALAPLIYLTFNLAYSIAAYPIGLLGDRIGKKKVLVMGYALFSINCLGFALVGNLWQAWILFVVYGVSHAISETIQRAIVPDFAGPEIRGSAFGVFHMSVGLAALPSSMIAGSLWQSYGSATAFLVSATIGFIACASLFLEFFRRSGGRSTSKD